MRGRDAFGTAGGAAAGDVGKDVFGDVRRWLGRLEDLAQLLGEFAVGVEVVG